MQNTGIFLAGDDVPGTLIFAGDDVPGTGCRVR
jgi:hypothetical protein